MHCPICRSIDVSTLFHYDSPPKGELPYPVEGPYRRRILQCTNCLHLFSLFGKAVEDAVKQINEGGFYGQLAYGDMEGVRKAYERARALPFESSDNYQRAGLIQQWFGYDPHRATAATGLNVLDVGSGLGVFLSGLREDAWEVMGVEVDPLLSRFTAEELKIPTLPWDFVASPIIEIVEDDPKFDLVALVHIIEHTREPQVFLERARDFLKEDGVVFVEVPSAEAVKNGPNSDEFLLDHRHIFSPASLCVLAEKTGYKVSGLECSQDPSGKWVIRSFLC